MEVLPLARFYVSPCSIERRLTMHPPFLSYCGILAFELFFVHKYLWETKGRTLEQTAALFDEDGTEDTLEETGTRAFRHRSLVSKSAHVNLRFSPKPEKCCQGERFEMTAAPQHPAYDWDRVYSEWQRADGYTSPAVTSSSKRVPVPAL